MSCLYQLQFMKCIYLVYISYLFLVDDNFLWSQEGNDVNIKKRLNVHFSKKVTLKSIGYFTCVNVSFLDLMHIYKGTQLHFFTFFVWSCPFCLAIIPHYPKVAVYCSIFLWFYITMNKAVFFPFWFQSCMFGAGLEYDLRIC